MMHLQEEIFNSGFATAMYLKSIGFSKTAYIVGEVLILSLSSHKSRYVMSMNRKVSRKSLLRPASNRGV